MAGHSIRLAVLLLGLLVTPVIQAQTGDVSRCRLIARGGEGRGKPVVEGNSLPVPKISLRFTNLTNPKDNTPPVVNVLYVWKWWEYPYPEHTSGAWNDVTYSLVECVGTQAGVLEIPPLVVVPRGWSAGLGNSELPLKKMPMFDHIEIGFEMEDCAPRLKLGVNEIKKLRSNGIRAELSCSAPNRYRFFKQ